jgi:hypothetical protein
MNTGEHLSAGPGRAVCLLQNSPHYRRDAFHAGFEKLGFSIQHKPMACPHANDVLVLWNRYARDEHYAKRYEHAGATVLITENAWLGPEEKDAHFFALCRGHHNGAGSWHVGAETRWEPVCEPWRKAGTKIMVLPQRGMGELGIAQPRDWLPSTMSRLQQITGRDILIHKHPGIRPHPPIDFSDVWACVTWASGAGIKAIVAGVPVFYDFKDWIAGPAACPKWGNLEDPYVGDREFMIHRLSWAMWSAEEIGKGEPFKWLLSQS